MKEVLCKTVAGETLIPRGGGGGWGGGVGGGALNKVLYGEAPPPRPKPLPFYIPVLIEKVPLSYYRECPRG